MALALYRFEGTAEDPLELSRLTVRVIAREDPNHPIDEAALRHWAMTLVGDFLRNEISKEQLLEEAVELHVRSHHAVLLDTLRSLPGGTTQWPAWRFAD